MTTLKQQLTLDGQAISNLDKDMVITLDAHPSVQIDTIQEDSITYKFLGVPAQDTTYSLNLTFVYKKIHKLVIPLNLVHVINDPKIELTPSPKSVKVWEKGTWADLPFTVMFLEDDGSKVDLYQSITNLVMTSNEYITITDNDKWKVTKGNTSAVQATEVEVAFDVTHGAETYHIVTKVPFNIAIWNGLHLDWDSDPANPTEWTATHDFEMKYYPKWEGEYAPQALVKNVLNSSNALDSTNPIVKQVHNPDDQSLTVTFKAATIIPSTDAGSFMMLLRVAKDPTATGAAPVRDLPVRYMKLWLPTVRVTFNPVSISGNHNQMFEIATAIRAGHRQLKVNDPDITFDYVSMCPVVGRTEASTWVVIRSLTAASNVACTFTFKYPNYTSGTGTLTVTASGGAMADTEMYIDSRGPVAEPNQTNVLTWALLYTGGAVPHGLVPITYELFDSPIDGNALIKDHRDLAMDANRAVVTVDSGWTGTAILISGVFKDSNGNNHFANRLTYPVKKATIDYVISDEPIKVANTTPVDVYFTLSQNRVGKDGVVAPVTLTSGTFANMTVTGEISAFSGAVFDTEKQKWKATVTPTAVSGVGVFKGSFTPGSPDPNISYPVEISLTFEKVTDFTITPAPLNVNVFQTGDDLPFEVWVEGVNKSADITDVVITPTTNVITSGGKNWEIWTAPTAGIAEKVKYNFKVEGYGGEILDLEYEATFNIAAWDGKMLKIAADDLIISATTTADKNTSFVVKPTYRGKPAADIVRLDTTNGGVLLTNATVISQEASSDKTELKITIHGNTVVHKENLNTAGTPLLNTKFIITDKPPTTEGIDTVSRHDFLGWFMGDTLIVTGFAGVMQGPRNSVTQLQTLKGTSPYSNVYVFKDGVRLKLDDPDVEFWVPQGSSASSPDRNDIAWEFMHADGTAVYGRIIQPYISATAGYYNPARVRLRSNPSKYKFEPGAPDGNLWVYPSSVNLNVQAFKDRVPADAVAADDNTIEFTVSNGGLTLANPTIFLIDAKITPSNGNALIKDVDYSITKHPTDATKNILKFAAGHTGTSVLFRAKTIDTAFAGNWAYSEFILPVPKSQVTFQPTATDIPGVGGQAIDIEFELNMMHYKQTPADLSGITFVSSSVVGAATSTGPAVHVSGNKFKIPVTLESSFGTAAISGAFTEPGSTIQYNFSGNVTTVNNSELHVTGITPFNVAMWERSSRLPFTVTGAGGEQLTDIAVTKITPRDTNVIAHGGAEWEIWTGPKEGGTSKVFYEFTVTHNGIAEELSYEATFNLPVWDGVMLTMDYNYEEEGKKTLLAPCPATGSAGTPVVYTVYPKYRGKAAPEMIYLRSQVSTGVTCTFAEVGITEDGLGYKFSYASGYVQAQGLDEGQLNFSLKDQYLNGQANTIAGVTAVTHAVKLRTYKVGLPTLIRLQVAPYPAVKNQSGFSAKFEVRMDKNKIDLDDPDITYVISGLNPYSRYVGADKEKLYFNCNDTRSSQTNLSVTNNVTASYKGQAAAAAQFNYSIDTTVTPVPVTITLLPNQVLEASSDAVVKFTLNKVATPLVVSKDHTLRSTITINNPTTGLALTVHPKGRLATMDADGVWSLPVKTGHTGDYFKLEGAAVDNTNPTLREEWAMPISSGNGVTVKRAPGIGKCKTEKFEVLGNTRTPFLFTLKMKQATGLVDIKAGTFKSIAISGPMEQITAGVPTFSTADDAWRMSGVALKGQPGIVKVSGVFTLPGSTVDYTMDEFEVEIVNISKVTFADIPTHGKVMQSSTVVPFETRVSGVVTAPTSVRFQGNTYIYGNNAASWRPEPTIPLEGGTYPIDTIVTITVDDVVETHTHTTEIIVDPWDGVEYTAKVSGSNSFYGLVGTNSGGITVDQTFRGSSVYQDGTWGSDTAHILEASDGRVSLYSEATSSPANRPVIAFKALGVGKFKFDAAVNYKGVNSTLWPVGTKDKNWQTYEIDVWIWDKDIRFKSGVQPGPIGPVATGDTITIPADLVYANDVSVGPSTTGMVITLPNDKKIIGGISGKTTTSFTANVTGVNHGTENAVAKVPINYALTVAGVTYTLVYEQEIIIKPSESGQDIYTFTNEKPISTRNWQKGILPFGITVNGVVGDIKDVKVTSNNYITGIPKDSLNNVWQCVKGGVDGPVSTQVEFEVTVNDGIRDHVVKHSVNVVIVKDDGSVFWIQKWAFTQDFDNMTAAINSGTGICTVQVYGMLRGDPVVTTGTFDSLGAFWSETSKSMGPDGLWTHSQRVPLVANTPRQGNVRIKLKYGTDSDQVGINVATIIVPVVSYATGSSAQMYLLSQTPEGPYTGKFGDKFIVDVRMIHGTTPVDMTTAAISVQPAFQNLIKATGTGPREITYEFIADVEEEWSTPCRINVGFTIGTVSRTITVANTFIQKPLIPKLDLAVSEITDIVGKFNDTGSKPLVVTYGGDIIPGNDPKLTITAAKGLQVTKTDTGFDYKVILDNTNPTGNYVSELTVSYEYASGKFATLVVDQPIKFTNTHRDVVLTDLNVPVEVWDFGTEPPFKLMVGTEDVTSLVTDLVVTPNDNVVQKAAGIWQIVANGSMTSVSVPTTFTYRLNDETFVRTGVGTFVIADYDGAEFTPYFDGSFSGAVDGYMMIPNTLATGGTNPSVNIRIVGKYRGEIAAITANGTPTSTGLEITVPTGSGNSLQYIVKSNVPGVFGGNTMRASIKRTGSPNNDVGLGTNFVDVPYIIYDSSKASYTIGDMTKTLSGKYGDVLDVKCVVVNSGAVVDLTDPNVVIETAGGRVEVVTGSKTKTGFKLKFAQDIGEDVTADQTVRIYNSVTPALEVNGSINITQIGGMIALELSPDFETSGSGEFGNPVTLKQSAIEPE